LPKANRSRLAAHWGSLGIILNELTQLTPTDTYKDPNIYGVMVWTMISRRIPTVILKTTEANIAKNSAVSRSFSLGCFTTLIVSRLGGSNTALLSRETSRPFYFLSEDLPVAKNKVIMAAPKRDA
jgi:hypothetical protein